MLSNLKWRKYVVLTLVGDLETRHLLISSLTFLPTIKLGRIAAFQLIIRQEIGAGSCTNVNRTVNPTLTSAIQTARWCGKFEVNSWAWHRGNVNVIAISLGKSCDRSRFVFVIAARYRIIRLALFRVICSWGSTPLAQPQIAISDWEVKICQDWVDNGHGRVPGLTLNTFHPSLRVMHNTATTLQASTAQAFQLRHHCVRVKSIFQVVDCRKEGLQL